MAPVQSAQSQPATGSIRLSSYSDTQILGAGCSPFERAGDGVCAASICGVVSAGVARSVTSVGIESERSAASTHLAELASEMNESQTSHLDNLMCLNERGGCGGGEPMESQ